MMNLELFFNALTMAWLAGEILIALYTTVRHTNGNVQDRGTQIILWAVTILFIGVDEWMHNLLPGEMPGGFTGLRAVAFGILVLGLGLRVVAIIVLRDAFTTNVAMRAAQKMERNGFHRFARHYWWLGLELILLALGLHARTWSCFAVVFIAATVAVLYRIYVEETALWLAFGADYGEYSSLSIRANALGKQSISGR